MVVAFLSERDVFAVRPTGYKKRLVFHLDLKRSVMQLRVKDQ